MSERKEPGLNLSGLDVQESDRRVSGAPQRAKVQVTDKPRGGGFLLTLILLVLTVGGAGLAYWTVGLKQALDSQQAELAKAQARLAEMEELLALTSDTASQSGQTLMGRIGQMESRAGEKYEHFDSEIAKLWTVAYQRNKPQLEEQKKALEAQAAELSELKKQLAAANSKLTTLGSSVDAGKSDLSGVKKQVSGLDKQVSGLEASLQQQSEGLKKVGADASFALSLEKDERISAHQALSVRVDKLAQGAQGGAGLSQRIASIEQSIQAIDGSRRQFNQSLLQMREQISELQRRLDGR
ncbi:hypothetical protein GCM10011352_06460 [Marinobacterium zhoushanense]|uniref:ATPase n=1 Tax=Marinobacterium zhoushanense TaxID=1679163 RepID=A0ABQ1K2W8_9GAMM|nr:hypothetical protein [Marinobacterium zhoushanense]GGB83328.1 hypothetical protein GCM10011352_06460 [Marinobacterium zhoushanense]